MMPNLNYGIMEIDNSNGAKVDANNGAKYKNTKEQLIAEIRQRPNITQTELSGILSLSRRTVQRMMKELINENKIARVGSTRSGYWKIID